MDASSGRFLAERLAKQNGDSPSPPIRGAEGETDAPPIFRWFAVQPPVAPQPAPAAPAATA